jgi:hypothetical protein
MFRTSFVNISLLLPRARTSLSQNSPALAIAASHIKAQMCVRLMSSSPEKAPQHPKIVHDMVHFKTSTNKHPLGIEKLSSDKEVRRLTTHLLVTHC